MAVTIKDFVEYVSVSHVDSGYIFKQDNERIRVVLAGTTIAFIDAKLSSNVHYSARALKQFAIEWLKENWEGK